MQLTLTVDFMKQNGADINQIKMFEEYLKQNDLQYIEITPQSLNELIREYWFDIDWLIKSGLIPNKEEYKKILRKNPKHAYFCAKYIEKTPNDLTRKAASQLYVYAFYYAKDIDMAPTRETCNAVLTNDAYAKLYSDLFFLNDNKERKVV